jgi:hypothetical protein
MRTVADYRQLNDALFHAGLNSGSQFEYIDKPNRLHFYVIDMEKNNQGILSYTLGVRSLDSGVSGGTLALAAPSGFKMDAETGKIVFILKGDDIYRLKTAVSGEGWSAVILNELAASADGGEISVPVWLTAKPGCSKKATVTLTAVSESNNEVFTEAKISVKR